MSPGPKWKSWIDEFLNLMLSLNTEYKKRMKALLLYYAGRHVHELYKTLTTDITEEYDAAEGNINYIF